MIGGSRYSTSSMSSCPASPKWIAAVGAKSAYLQRGSLGSGYVERSMRCCVMSCSMA
jgi:hypothetical protein